MQTFKETFTQSFLGTWSGDKTTTVTCGICGHAFAAEADADDSDVTCPNCNHKFSFVLQPPQMKLGGIALLLIGGGISGAVIAYLNHFFDITGIYFFFVIPIGAIVFGLAANLGFVAFLAMLRTKGVNYNKALLVLLSAIISVSAYWLSEYTMYRSSTIEITYISSPEIEEREAELEKMAIAIDSISSSIDESAKKIDTNESALEKLNKQLEAEPDGDPTEYNRLLSLDADLVTEHNKRVKKGEEIVAKYNARVVELNLLMDRLNTETTVTEGAEIKIEPLPQHLSFLEYIEESYANMSFHMFGARTRAPVSTPSADGQTGSSGLGFLFLKHIGFIFALPALWRQVARRRRS